MKKLYFTLIILFITISINAQISQIEFERKYEKLIDNLSKENWSVSDSLAEDLLQNINNLDSMYYETMVLRYISIYCTAGMLNEQNLTKEDALIKVKKFEGLEMIMPAHPVKKDCYFNCTYLSSDRANTFFTGVNNSAGTQIFSFEYVKMKNKISPKILKNIEGKFITLKGNLKEISVEGNILPRFRMEFEEGEMQIINE